MGTFTRTTDIIVYDKKWTVFYLRFFVFVFDRVVFRFVHLFC